MFHLLTYKQFRKDLWNTIYEDILEQVSTIQSINNLGICTC